VAEEVKTRAYDSTRRQERTRATRRRVLEAARALFVERGYPATSMEAISTAADVPAATLYRLFPAKRAILKEVVDVTAVGDDVPVALHDRPEVLALRDERDARRYLAAFARLVRVLHERLDPVHRMLRSAAPVDPDAAAMLATIREQRYAGQGVVARGLVERRALKGSLTEDTAHDIIYALMSPELRHVLIDERGWTHDQYEAWLADCLCATLLEEPEQHAAKPR
jgi:AcrR family transcriptional regulator